MPEYLHDANVKPEKLIIILLFAALSFSARADWLVQTYRDGSSVTALADADRLIANTTPIATGTIPYTDLLGYSTGEGTGHFSLNYPVPGFPQSQETDDYAVEVTGTLNVPVTGYCTFGLNTDDGARLVIDGTTIITDDAIHPPRDSAYVSITLAAGSHSVSWIWFNHDGGATAEVFWAGGIYTGFNSSFVLLGNSTTTTQPISQNGTLVAYWPFSGNANDASGNGNNCVVYGAQLTTNRFGSPNSAFSFDGNSYLERTAFSGAAAGNPITISAWVFKTSTNPSVHETILATEEFRFQTRQQGQLDCGVVGSSWFEASPVLPMQLNTWHHVVVVLNGTTIQLYQDGALILQAINSAAPVQIRNCRIGCDGLSGIGGTDYFNGTIDDVRVYSRALSASEVQQLYSMADIGTAPTPPTVVQTNRTPSSTELGTQTSGNFKVFTKGTFVSGVALDQSKKTIVLTHGWNSSSDDWPSNMASQFVAGGIAANIVAWDWRDDAKFDCSTTLSKTPWQGFLLGSNLLQNLGAGYSQPIHFIGHSFGTLVNAAAANYLHGEAANNNPPQHLSPSRTQITLLDEAEIANVLGKPKVVNPTTANLGWIKPLPNSFAWADNYVSAVGELHDNAVNIILTENSPGIFYSSFTDLWNALVVYHGEPCQWYGQTVTNPAGSVMGNIWSFERTNSFATPAPGTCFEQFGNGLGLEQISRAGADQFRFVQNGALFEEIVVYYVLKEANVGVSIVGDVTANVIETALTDPNPVFQTTPATIGISTYAPATPDFWSPQLMLQNHPFNLGPNWKPLNVHPLGGPSSTPSNSPAYAWLPMTIPSNATSLSFDFMLVGDGAGDSFDAALNGTNVFSLATSLIQTNVTMNSGLIDVSSYAGQNVELFLGIVGGASTNTILTVSGIRLYSVMPPLLQAQMSGNNFVLSWPLSAADYVLQTSTNLTDTNSWTAVPNVPAIVNLQNTVTNSVSDGTRFYRLKK